MRTFYKILSSLFISALFIMVLASIQPRHDMLGWYLLATVLLLSFFKGKYKRFFRFAFIVISLFVSVRYLVFRSYYTLSFADKLAIAPMLMLFVAEVYSIFSHFFSLGINMEPLKRKKPELPEKLPKIDVFIPTYNEDESVAIITGKACLNFDYPKELVNVYILNDGSRLNRLNDKSTREKAYERHLKLKEMAEKAGLFYMTREDGRQAKAGMINAAFTGKCFKDITMENDEFKAGARITTGGDLILILDCDHIPTKDFLKETIGYFEEDEKLFLVQTPHSMINEDPLRKNLDDKKWLPAEGWLFYQEIQKDLDRWNASFFCGSAAVLRRKSLEETGGLSGDTITEDCETALSLHAKGHSSVYVAKPMIAGLEPETFDSLIGQRSRWCQGMLQILILKNPLFKKGLTFMQRMSYLNNCLYWFFPIFRVIFLISPLFFLYFGLNIYNATLEQVVNYAFPHLILSFMTAYLLYSGFRPFLFSEVLETMQSIFLLPAMFSVFVSPKKPQFKATPKGIRMDKESLSRLYMPFFIIFIVFIIAFVRSGYIYYNYPLLKDAIYLTTFWLLFNFVILLCCIGVLVEKKQQREHHRCRIFSEKVKINGKETNIVDLSLSGIKVKNSFGKEPIPQEFEAETIDGSGYKFKVEVTRSDKDIVAGKIRDFTSLANIDFVYGKSSRWENKIDDYRSHKKRQFVLPFYLAWQGLKGSLRAFFIYFLSFFKKGILSFLILFLFAEAGRAEVINVPLKDLAGSEEQIVRNVYTNYEIPFFISPRWKLKQGELYLYSKSEKTLNKDNILTRILINDKSVSEEGSKFNIPLDLLKNGRNILTIETKIKSNNKQCLFPKPLFSWDLKGSYFSFDYDYTLLAKDANVRDIFNENDIGTKKIALVQKEWTESKIKKAILTASKVGILIKNRGLDVVTSKDIVANRDNILLDDESNEIKELGKTGYYAIASGAVLQDEVIRKNIIEPDKVYTFADLGAENITLRGFDRFYDVNFFIPSTIYLSPNDKARISLNIVYGRLIKKGSKLKVSINGKQLAEMALDNLKGKDIPIYDIEVPLSDLKKGENVLSFRAEIEPAHEYDCADPIREGLFVTIFKSSKISFSEAKTYFSLPDLSLFFNDGFPFDGNTDIFIETENHEFLDGFIEISASVAQRRGSTISKGTDIHKSRPKYMGKNYVAYRIDDKIKDDVLLITEDLIDNTGHVRLDIRASSYKDMTLGADFMFGIENRNNLSGDTVEINYLTGEINSYYGKDKRLIESNLGPLPKLSFLFNNYPQVFYGALILIIIIVAFLISRIMKEDSTDE